MNVLRILSLSRRIVRCNQLESDSDVGILASEVSVSVLHLQQPRVKTRNAQGGRDFGQLKNCSLVLARAAASARELAVIAGNVELPGYWHVWRLSRVVHPS